MVNVLFPANTAIIRKVRLHHAVHDKTCLTGKCGTANANAVGRGSVGQGGRQGERGFGLDGVQELSDGLVEEDDGALSLSDGERQKVHLHFGLRFGFQVHGAHGTEECAKLGRVICE